jgi:hypothetical protein
MELPWSHHTVPVQVGQGAVQLPAIAVRLSLFPSSRYKTVPVSGGREPMRSRFILQQRRSWRCVRRLPGFT